MELKQLSERQRAEAADRAAKVFNLRPRAKQGATVPEPFQLAGHALLEASALAWPWAVAPLAAFRPQGIDQNAAWCWNPAAGQGRREAGCAAGEYAV